MSAPVLELRGLAVGIAGRVLLANLDLRVEPGERIAILGPNGAGKSTLIDVLVGLQPPLGGEVLLLGEAPPSPSVALVPQQAGTTLLPWLRARDNVLLPLRLRGTRADLLEAALDRARERVDPTRRVDLDAYPDRLSGGERQLVALMRGLVGRPRLLLCDEPFDGIDLPGREHLRAAMVRACAERDPPALLLVTHHAEDCSGLCGRALVLENGFVDEIEPSEFRPRLLGRRGAAR